LEEVPRVKRSAQAEGRGKRKKDKVQTRSFSVLNCSRDIARIASERKVIVPEYVGDVEVLLGKLEG
jgi:hypothetical protein